MTNEHDGATPETGGLVMETANDRFKKSFGTWLWGSMIAATVLHFIIFQFFPDMYTEDFSVKSEEVEVVTLPEVELPPPPEQIQRPARPVISDAVINEEITIADTDFETLPDTELPPRPVAPEQTSTGGPQFTPFEVAPVLSNRGEMEQALMREYPPVLRDAGIGGTVALHFHISETGEVLETVLAESSGHAAMDEAAGKVATVMKFTPAQNLDKTVPVWVSINITFVAR